MEGKYTRTTSAEDTRDAVDQSPQDVDDVYRTVCSAKSIGSYGATSASGPGERRGSRRGDGVFIKRMSSTATCDRPFERQASKLSSVASGKSLTGSYRTRVTSVSRSEYHDDLKPQLHGGCNLNLVFTTFIIVFGSSFQFGYNIGVLNQPSELIKSFYQEAYTDRYGALSKDTVIVLWSLTTALFIPGGMFGAFLGGWLADKIGRKRTILLSHVFAFAGAALSSACVAAKAPEMLMIGRVLVGINSGIGNCLAPMFLSEISPYNIRGALGTVHQLSITIGIFLSSVFGLQSMLGTADKWPYLILLEAIPAATSLFILPFLPETPRFLLLSQSDRPASEKSLKFYRRTDDVSTEMEEMDTEHQESDERERERQLAQDGDAKEQKFTLKQLLCQRELLKPLLIAALLQVAQQFSGINAIFFYSSGIYENAGIPKSQIPYTVVGTNAVNVFMTVITVPLMDKMGRRPLLLIPMLVMILDLALLTAALNLQDEVEWFPILSIVCIIIYVICFAVGLGPIPMMIGAELFRQGPRPLAMAVAGVVNWVATFVIAMTFEPIQEKAGEFTFIIFLVLLIAFLLPIFFLVPETKNKTFEEIAHQFSPGGELEVEEMVDDDDVFAEETAPAANEEGDQEEHNLVTINFHGNGNENEKILKNQDIGETTT